MTPSFTQLRTAPGHRGINGLRTHKQQQQGGLQQLQQQHRKSQAATAKMMNPPIAVTEIAQALILCPATLKQRPPE